MSNNLTELNNILFDTLRGLKDGSIDKSKTKEITNVSNTIINNAKTQLEAFKLTKSKETLSSFSLSSSESNVEKLEVNTVGFDTKKTEFVKQKKPLLNKKDTYSQKHDFSIISGYGSVGEALSKIGKKAFEDEFNSWVNKD